MVVKEFEFVLWANRFQGDVFNKDILHNIQFNFAAESKVQNKVHVLRGP